MDEITIFDKVKYYMNYLYDIFYLKMFPYKNVYVFDNNNNYSDDSYILNYIESVYNYNNNFNNNKKVLISYSGEKEFYVSLSASSYSDIRDKINTLIKNNTFISKIQIKLPNFIENIYFITWNDDKIDIKNIIDKCITFDDICCDITFNDIVLLLGETGCSMESIEVDYVRNFKKIKKELSFEENKNKDIQLLNVI